MTHEQDLKRIAPPLENAWPALNNLSRVAYQNAKTKGFWDRGPDYGWRLMLIVSEVAEACEAFRELGRIDDPEELRLALQRITFNEKGKPEGFASELADVLIRVFDLAGGVGIDLGAIVTLKMNFNANRPHMHGGKAV